MAWLSVGTSNDDLCDQMIRNGIQISDKLINAFRKTDRGEFVLSSDRIQAYHDRPFKKHFIHISAPHMYVTVLEALDLQPGQSFLNVGSGSGYLCCLASCLLGKQGLIHGIEVNAQAVDHSRECIRRWQLSQNQSENPPTTTRASGGGAHEDESITIVHGNCFDIDILSSAYNCRYDRIYIGAGCPENRKEFFYHLLAEDGILVAPINERNQMLKVRKLRGNIFQVNGISSVFFAPLIETNMRPDEVNIHGNRDNSTPLASLLELNPDSVQVLTRNPQTMFQEEATHGNNHQRVKLPTVLWAPTKSRHQQFPVNFRKAVNLILLASNSSNYPSSTSNGGKIPRYYCNMLPNHVWFVIFSYCSRDWFQQSSVEAEALKVELFTERQMRKSLEEQLVQAEQARRQAERERDLFRMVLQRMETSQGNQQSRMSTSNLHINTDGTISMILDSENDSISDTNSDESSTYGGVQSEEEELDVDEMERIHDNEDESEQSEDVDIDIEIPIELDSENRRSEDGITDTFFNTTNEYSREDRTSMLSRTLLPNVAVNDHSLDGSSSIGLLNSSSLTASSEIHDHHTLATSLDSHTTYESVISSSDPRVSNKDDGNHYLHFNPNRDKVPDSYHDRSESFDVSIQDDYEEDRNDSDSDDNYHMTVSIKQVA